MARDPRLDIWLPLSGKAKPARNCDRLLTQIWKLRLAQANAANWNRFNAGDRAKELRLDTFQQLIKDQLWSIRVRYQR